MEQNEPQIIIGFTGSFGSGCNEASEYLEKSHNFSVYSLSNKIKKETLKQGIKYPQRKDYQDMGNLIRKKHGADYLAREILSEINIKSGNSIVIKSIRNQHEASFFSDNLKSFFLINIDTNKNKRLERVKKTEYRDREEDFERDDEKDTGDDEPDYGQHIQKCVDVSDIVINNESNKKELHGKIDKYLYLMRNPGKQKPNQLELNMALAFRCSLNSTCLKRQVGAIIEKENQIISSGYNDTPAEIKSCEFFQYCYRKDFLSCLNKECQTKISHIYAECPECKTKITKEQREALEKHLDLCQAIHAEEKAILQTAKFGGQSLKNSTLYTTTFPCLLCAKKIIEVGIDEVVYLDPYPYSKSYELLEEAKIKLTKFIGVKSKSLDKLYSKYI